MNPAPRVSPELWSRLEPLLDAALDMDPSARDAWLDGLEATQPELAPVLRRLIAHHDRAERLRDLETVPRLADAPAWSSAHAPDETIGPFRLLRPLGHGGMGEVWLARQVDGRVEREVALKLPALQGGAPYWRERFRRERDILARLVHPNIARLYDAGASDAGQPYLALEYVEGEALDAYVARTRLAIPARLVLFRQVLAAVAHAHRHLVVHRDLKPANILIDREGQVKLLDFGIAKFAEGAEEEGSDLTRAGGRLLTMRYAAPEQVAAGAVTTVTDVYSLGVVLHELLAGASPYRAARERRPLTDMAVANEDIALPSSLAPALAGDLDAILLKALRRDPAERYPTVEAFDEDIGRFLEHRPVLARAGTWRYLAGRFLRRHRLPIAAAATVFVALALGLVLADRERRVAVAERARAQKHFDSVRKLANTFIFDVHGELSEVPGALKARELLMKTSLEYLDALAAEAGADPGLQFELAAAYRRIATVQGQPGASNLGDLPAALRSYEKGKALLVAVDRARPRDLAALREHVILSFQLARVYAEHADPRWQAESAATVDLAARAAALPGADMRDRVRVPGVMAAQAQMIMIFHGQSPEVEALAGKAIGMVEALAKEEPRARVVRNNLAGVYRTAAEILTGDRWTAESALRAVAYRRKALELLAELRREFPNDQRYRSTEIENLLGLANDYRLAGQVREADAAVALARAAMRTALEADPDNADVAHTAVSLLAVSSIIARQAGDNTRALAEAREALALDARRPAGSRDARESREMRSRAQFALGTALLAAGQAPGIPAAKRGAMLREARTHLADSRDFLQAARAEKLGAVDPREVRNREQALRDCEEALRHLGAA